MSIPTTPGFVERRTLVFWVTIGLMVLGVYWQITTETDLWGDNPGAMVVAAVFWAVYGIAVGWLIHRLQLFERRAVSSTIAAVVWGIFVAGGIVALVGPDLQALLDKVVGIETSREWGPAIRAPFIEESWKLLGVVALALIPRVRVVRVIDGVYFGMLSGLGFLVSENAFFTNQAVNLEGASVGTAVFETFLSRGVFALPFSHVIYSGIAGAGIGYVLSRRGRSVIGRVLVAFGLYVVAFLLHGFNNSPILGDAEFSLFIKGIPALAIFLVVLWWARREYRADLAELAAQSGTITDEDLDALSTRRHRRTAAKHAADHQLVREAQRAQIDLLVATDVYGPESPQVADAQRLMVSPVATDTPIEDEAD